MRISPKLTELFKRLFRKKESPKKEAYRLQVENDGLVEHSRKVENQLRVKSLELISLKKKVARYEAKLKHLDWKVK